MKIKFNSPIIAVFAAVFSFSCFLISREDINGIFGFNSFLYQLIKLSAVFILIFILTLLNKNNIDKISNYCRYFTMVVSVIYFIDSSFFRFSGTLYYRLWWLLTIHIAVFAVYFAVLFIKNINFNLISSQLIKGYSILYTVSFVSVFLRPMGEAATTNFIPGSGTLKFIPYLISYPQDWSIWIITLGNVIFFIPIAFILKTLIPKIKLYQQIAAGLLMPVFIESYQLILKCGDVDIDDIILNFTGFLIGLLLLVIQNKIKLYQKKEVI